MLQGREAAPKVWSCRCSAAHVMLFLFLVPQLYWYSRRRIFIPLFGVQTWSQVSRGLGVTSLLCVCQRDGMERAMGICPVLHSTPRCPGVLVSFLCTICWGAVSAALVASGAVVLICSTQLWQGAQGHLRPSVDEEG